MFIKLSDVKIYSDKKQKKVFNLLYYNNKKGKISNLESQYKEKEQKKPFWSLTNSNDFNLNEH